MTRTVFLLKEEQMSAHKLVVKHISGESYKIHLPREGLVQTSLIPKSFWDEGSARQFVNSIAVTPDYWCDIINQCGSFSGSQLNTANDIEKEVSQLLVRDKLKFYPVNILDTNEHPPEKRVIKSNNNTTYRFEPSSTLLFTKQSEIKKFSNTDEAKAFLSKLSTDNEKLTAIAKELKIKLPVTAAVNKGETANAISETLASGQVVIIVDKTSTVPPSTKEVLTKSDVGNRAAGLGAGGTEEDETKNKEKPPCQLEWVSIECSHGRTSGITAKTETTPNLDVISTESKKSGFDLITAEIHATELCSSHKNNIFGISKPHKFKSKTEKKVQFHVSCDEWDVSNLFERIWLPSVKPKTYNISIKNTCEAPDIKIKDVNVNVYPDMKWHWTTTIDFGKLEFVPGKAKIKYSDFDIDGNVELTYDGKKHDAKEKYKKYIKEPLDGFKKICDTISKVLEVINDPKAALTRIGTQTDKKKPENGKDNKDGNETRLIIDWPKLAIDYDSSLLENKSSTFIDHEYSIKITAKPLLEIDIQVDVLDSMMSLAPPPVSALMKYAKNRIEQEFDDDQEAGLRGELDIIFTVKATVNINESEIKGRHNIIENDVSVEPIKGDIKIPAKLKGAVKAEGKWFIVSFKVHYDMKGETEWSGDFEFGNDDKGIYFSNTVEFKGIDVTFTKYEEVKAEVETDQIVNDGFFADAEVTVKSDDKNTEIKLEEGKLKGESTLKAEDEKRWSWLKPEKNTEKQSSQKYYFINR